MLAARIDRTLHRNPDRPKLYPDCAKAAMQKLYFDVAGASSAGAIAALRELMPLVRLLYGSDAPFVAPDEELHELDQSNFSAAERTIIEHDNPLRLLPHFASD